MDAPADVLVPALIHADLDAQHLRKRKGGEKKGLVRLAEPVVQQVARLRRLEIVAVAEPVAHITAAQYVQEHVQISAQDAWEAVMMSVYIHAQRHAQKTVQQIARWLVAIVALLFAEIAVILAVDLPAEHHALLIVLELARNIAELLVVKIVPEPAPEIVPDAEEVVHMIALDVPEPVQDTAPDAMINVLRLAHSPVLDVPAAVPVGVPVGQGAVAHAQQPARIVVQIHARSNVVAAVPVARVIVRVIAERLVLGLAME